MRKLFDSEANEIEVPDNEEITKWQETAKKAEELEAKIKELEGKPENVDWREARKKMKLLEDEVAKSGKRVTDDGKITEEPKPMTREEIEKIADERAERTLYSKTIIRYLGGYKEEEKALIKKYFDKLTSGEMVSSDNVEDYLRAASSAAFPEQRVNPFRMANARTMGAPTYESPGGSKFAESPEGKELHNKLFPNQVEDKQ